MKNNKSLKAYLAGPLFSRGEVRDRINDESQLREAFPKLEIFNPINFNKSFDSNSKITQTTFFDKDVEEMKTSDIAIIDIDNMDPGTICELGWFINSTKDIYIIYSNWKQEQNDLKINKFVEGAIIKKAISIEKDIKDVIIKMKGKYKHELLN